MSDKQITILDFLKKHFVITEVDKDQNTILTSYEHYFMFGLLSLKVKVNQPFNLINLYVDSEKYGLFLLHNEDKIRANDLALEERHLIYFNKLMQKWKKQYPDCAKKNK